MESTIHRVFKVEGQKVTTKCGKTGKFSSSFCSAWVDDVTCVDCLPKCMRPIPPLPTGPLQFSFGGK